jgi:Uncharacterized protein conserved in bacteria (DUF2213)
MPKENNFNYDEYGFLRVWLPYGTPTLISSYGEHSDYLVESSQLLNPISNSTLAGSDITIGHPKNEVINPSNYKKYSVGTCLGDLRFNDESNTYEVLCLIKDKLAIQGITLGLLVETSPCYIEFADFTRCYNHIALLPFGNARGGRTMTVKLEGNPFDSINNNSHNKKENIILTPEDLQKISEIMTTSLKSLLEVAEVDDAKMDSIKTEGFDAGFKEGVESGRIISTANSATDYDGSDVNEAKLALVSKAFPSLKTEGRTADEISAFVEAAICSVGRITNAAPTSEDETGKVPTEVTVKVEGEEVLGAMVRKRFQAVKK